MAKETVCLTIKNLSVRSLAAVCKGLIQDGEQWKVRVPKDGQCIVFFIPDDKDVEGEASSPDVDAPSVVVETTQCDAPPLAPHTNGHPDSSYPF